MTFRVGQKVVCIKKDRWVINVGGQERGETTFPVFGEVYTVRDVEFFDGEEWLLLNEIVNPKLEHAFGAHESVFAACRFRPVVDKKTDIGFAHEILRKASRTKEAAA